MLTYRETLPPAALTSFVDAFWTAIPTGEPQDVCTPFRVLPDGCIDLIFHRGTNGGDGRLVVFGPTDQHHVVNPDDITTSVGVRFKPGMAVVCLDLSPPELYRREVVAHDCLPRLGTLHERLADCSTAQQVLLTLQAAVAPLAERQALPRVGQAVTLFRQGHQVAGVARQLGVSESTLRRDVTSAVGLAPKTLARVLRFRTALRLLHTPQRGDLASLALDTGYADQAHMNRDFRALSGLTPTAFP